LSAATGTVPPIPSSDDLARTNVLGAVVNLNQPAHYVHIGSWFQMSVPNLIVIIVMLVLFGLAITLPFPGRRHRRGGGS
jgi:hypothetical protein